MFTVKVQGLREVQEKLGKLGPALGPATMTLALQDAAEPLVAAAKAKAPYDETRSRGKHLRDTIAAHARLSRSQRVMMPRPGFASVFVGPSSRAPHAHLVEFGHVMTVNRGPNKGRVIRQVPAYPFLRPAWDATRDQVLARLAARVHMVVDAVARGAAVAAAEGNMDRRAAASVIQGEA